MRHRAPRSTLLEQTGLDFELLDSGCCGMAGSFGFEAEHYDVSVAVRRARPAPGGPRGRDDTLIVADGFCCREQIEQA